ncbi:HD domain-containing protein [Schwartzia succinivorans]|jgi:putative nucleotidyltransferase with HDIG domain|uniref:HDIG domain-containing protein n=1 Tax=Schwartzia succinivorans DSM 10502 TaxID=1123243 RepID=A0A1M4VYQ4_9FIRM|nr:HD domain-containing protein [Schwartzia succinivorans]SHE74079.1 HDIG domain-containing protein [Schwartzia succinivorans DSM 10502]
MAGRLYQFYRAVTASLTEADRQYVEMYLPAEAQKLFWNMSTADQYHALHVAYTALEIAKSEECDSDLLRRSALLHDVGRVNGSMNVWEKSIAVIIAGCFPDFARRQAGKNNGWLSGLFHVYFFHPQIGEKMLREIGMDKEADMISRHHDRNLSERSIELKILQLADSKN